ncbi:ribose-phosphate pyrophosphokinase [bacterium]|nr:ribose-phosphate pyrophosphokinase [bacterium]
MKIVTGRANILLAQKISDYLHMPLADVDIITFQDGEIKVKYNENIRGVDLFIIQPTNPPGDNLLELLLLIDAARRASAKRITAVIPYFGYARQDRKDEPRVALSAKLVADLISVAGADRILTMDLHSASIQGFFNIPLDHLYGSVIFIDAIKNLGFKNLVVVAPDIGSTRRARAYASRLHTDLALVDKRRTGPNQVEGMTLIGNVEGKDAVLVDDMVDTAGTICKAATILKNSGAKNIAAVGTHPLLSGAAIDRLLESDISKMILSDTISISKDKLDRCKNCIKVVSAAPLFGESIQRIHSEESISSLFN